MHHVPAGSISDFMPIAPRRPDDESAAGIGYPPAAGREEEDHSSMDQPTGRETKTARSICTTVRRRGTDD
jgi:hypothetical protein